MRRANVRRREQLWLDMDPDGEDALTQLLDASIRYCIAVDISCNLMVCSPPTRAIAASPCPGRRFAIIGPPERCIRRLQALIDLGIRRVMIGPREAYFGVEPQAAMARFAAEVTPALRGSPLER